MPGPSSRTRITQRSAVLSTDAVTVVPTGVCTRALANRLATTWCRRASSPVTRAGRVQEQRELPVVVLARRPRVPHRLRHEGREVHLGGLQGAAVVQPGQEQQVLDQARHPGRLGRYAPPRQRRLDPVGPPVHQLRVPGDGGQRRTEFVAGVGQEAAHAFLAALPLGEGGLDVVDHAIEGGADLACLAAGVRVAVGHPGQAGDLTPVQRGAGDLDGGGGDPAEGAAADG